MGIPEAEAVVDLTLTQLARAHLLELPVESRGDRSAPTRRWLLGRGLAAAMLPAIYSIVAPSPVEAQSPRAGRADADERRAEPRRPGRHGPVTLTGTNFIVGATTVNVASGGVTAANVDVSSPTSLTADIAITAAAVPDAHTADGHDVPCGDGPLAFNANAPPRRPVPDVHLYGRSADLHSAGGRDDADGDRAGCAGRGGEPSGLGGSVTATFTVVPSEILNVRVGGQGGEETPSSGAGGFNGGGAGGTNFFAGGGGGASDIRIAAVMPWKIVCLSQGAEAAAAA